MANSKERHEMGVHMGVPWLCAPYFLLLEAGRLSPRLSVCQTDVPPLLLTWVFSTSSWASLCLSSLHVCPSNLEGLGSEVWGAAENSHVQQVPRCCCQNLPREPGALAPSIWGCLQACGKRLRSQGPRHHPPALPT